MKKKLKLKTNVKITLGILLAILFMIMCLIYTHNKMNECINKGNSYSYCADMME